MNKQLLTGLVIAGIGIAGLSTSVKAEDAAAPSAPAASTGDDQAAPAASEIKNAMGKVKVVKQGSSIASISIVLSDGPDKGKEVSIPESKTAKFKSFDGKSIPIAYKATEDNKLVFEGIGFYHKPVAVPGHQ